MVTVLIELGIFSACAQHERSLGVGQVCHCRAGQKASVYEI